MVLGSSAGVFLTCGDDADDTAGNEYLKRSFQGIDVLLHFPHILRGIEPQKYVNVNPGPGPTRPDSVELIELFKRAHEFL